MPTKIGCGCVAKPLTLVKSRPFFGFNNRFSFRCCSRFCNRSANKLKPNTHAPLVHNALLDHTRVLALASGLAHQHQSTAMHGNQKQTHSDILLCWLHPVETAASP